MISLHVFTAIAELDSRVQYNLMRMGQKPYYFNVEKRFIRPDR